MTKAIFHREFHYTSRKRNAGWSAYPNDEPQSFPREFIDAAVNAGCAELRAPSIAQRSSILSPTKREPGKRLGRLLVNTLQNM